MSKISKLSRTAANQYYHMPASASTVFPNADFTVYLTQVFCGLTTGDNPQYLLSTGPYSSVMGAVNLVLQTSGGLNNTAGRIQLFLDNTATASSSVDSFYTGAFKLVLRRKDGVIQLLSCPVLANAPVDASAVKVQFSRTVTTGFSNPSGIYLGSRADKAANRFSDQSISRVGYVPVALTDLEIAKLAFGTPIETLGYTSVWNMEDGLTNLGTFTQYGTPTEIDAPAYGYTEWGTFKKPYCADSLWNSRPINPVFSTIGVPAIPGPVGTSYFMESRVANGAYSTGCFQIFPTDASQTLIAESDSVHNSDTKVDVASYVFPHWNATILPAVGSDGHADVFDVANDRIYSFWRMKNPSAGVWKTHQMSWSKLSGYGWGNGGHFSLGARASGVASSAGLIRAHEIGDGKERYEHALTMSLDYSGMGKGCVPPATLCDSGQELNKGGIPEGSIVGLPADFPEVGYNAEELKIIKSLKPGGCMAYITDRNEDTPFVIYVENGCTPPLTTVTGLHKIRAGLRMMASCDGFLNGNGQPRTPDPDEKNMFSMRGPYSRHNNTVGPLCVYNTFLQGVEFPESTVVSNCLQGGRPMNWVDRFKFVPGKTYRMTAYGGTAGLAKVRLTASTPSMDAGWLYAGQSSTFTWTGNGQWISVEAQKGPGPADWIGANIVEVLP